MNDRGELNGDSLGSGISKRERTAAFAGNVLLSTTGVSGMGTAGPVMPAGILSPKNGRCSIRVYSNHRPSMLPHCRNCWTCTSGVLNETSRANAK